MIFAEIKKTKTGSVEEEQEEIQVLKMDLEQAYRSISTSEIKDAKSIMLIQYTKLNKLFTT